MPRRSSPAAPPGRANTRSTPTSMLSATWSNAASLSSSSSGASPLASRRRPRTTSLSSPSRPLSYGCGECPQNLEQAATGVSATKQAKPEPVVPPNKSVRPDHIVCLFDGKKFKSLKRHIRVSHGMTPQQYREAFDLRQDYPMVAPAYASARSELAK